MMMVVMIRAMFVTDGCKCKEKAGLNWWPVTPKPWLTARPGRPTSFKNMFVDFELVASHV